MSSSWTQVHLSGLDAAPLSLESFELALSSLFVDEDDLWAGPGTTILKQARNSNNAYCFIAFYSLQGAVKAVERLNGYNGNDERLLNLRAELSQPKPKKATKSQHNQQQKQQTDDNIRLRRKRAPPAPKHPIRRSSAPPKSKSQG